MPSLSQDDQVLLLQLHSIHGLGDKSIVKIFQETQDLSEIWERVRKKGYPFLLNRDYLPTLSYEQAKQLWYQSQQMGIKVIPIFDASYPEVIRRIYDPPPILYVRGRIELLGSYPALAVVGTRRYTQYGHYAVQRIVGPLVDYGMVIISGMALGIDLFAHQECLERGGQTIAVLGSGVDVATPIQNGPLYQDIIQQGCVVSEFTLGRGPDRYTFPKRNRLISALAGGVLVVEAGEKSGALITADHALDQGKEVYALPGPVDSHASVGPHRLIQLGAKLVTCAEDVWEDYCEMKQAKVGLESGETITDPVERAVFNLITTGTITIDDILEALEFDAPQILTAISGLELQGKIQRLPGDRLGVG